MRFKLDLSKIKRVGINCIEMLSASDEPVLIEKGLDSIAKIEALTWVRSSSRKILCLFPSAQPTGVERQVPIFHRWSWAAHFPDYHVLCFSDPALYYSKLHAAWFQSPNATDIIEEISSFIREFAERFDVSLGDIVLYGSSMGGFGALMVGTQLRGGLSIAEVPQLDLRKYPFRAAISSIEQCYYGGEIVEDYYFKYPHRVSVMERIRRERYVPNVKLITNRSEFALAEHLRFPEHVIDLSAGCDGFGSISISLSPLNIGHAPLPTTEALKYLRSSLIEPRAEESLDNVPKAVNLEESYNSVLKNALEISGKVKFTRTDDDKKNYDAARRLLAKAAEINALADWPLLKLCSFTKLWTNSFNREIYDFATRALARRESLEAFIYCCRGAVYNFNGNEARDMILQLQSIVSDKNIRNVGNIFIGILDYDIGDYIGFEKAIKLFNNNKDENFSPYIAIPVQTVFVETDQLLDVDAGEISTLIGKKLELADFQGEDFDYLVSVSCDPNYFFKYGEFIVRSFSRSCSERGLLHISLTSGNHSDVNDALQNWGARGVVFVIQGIESKENVGPIASLIRFSHVHSFLKLIGKPVLVLDLDTVITSPLDSLFKKYANYDVCSRILGKGVAPWEKYTGGFALFNPTIGGIKVAERIALAASIMIDPDIKQWWVDQNCFEAGIRATIKEGFDLNLVDFSNSRGAYCVMPVGNAEAKLFELQRALALTGIELD